MTTSRYEEALALAQRWHLTQLRKGTEDERIAGLLHDALGEG